MDDGDTRSSAGRDEAGVERALMSNPLGLRNKRKHRRAGEVVLGGLLLALIGVTTSAAVVSVVRHGWAADAAAWAQAAGAIVAIVGAAWLARGEARQARRWRREQGEEAAWGVRYALIQAQFDSQIIAAELTGDKKAPDATDVLSWQQRSANASLILQTMLTRVDHIHPLVVATMCNAKILIDQLSIDLLVVEKAIKKNRRLDERIVSGIVYAHINLAKLIEEYDVRMRGVVLALDEGDDMLPIDNWEPWSQRRSDG